MLDERKANILRAVVEQYIETAQPVGSGVVADAPGVQVSSATVRNDMVALESDGYLAQPHTSAGRIPTEKGYRFFVDNVVDEVRLARSDAKSVRTFFSQAHVELERMLADTTRLLSNLTHYAAVVVGPSHEEATIRSLQLVALTDRIVLAVVVLSNGVIEKQVVEAGADVSEQQVAEASALVASQALGRTGDGLRQVADEALRHTDPAVTALARQAVGTLRGESAEAEHVYIGGAAEIAAAFDAVATVSEVLRILEQQYLVVRLLNDVLDRGLNVAIGTEVGVEPLADCSVVVAPVEVDGQTAGTVGVLGPTRMNYQQAMAAVAVVSKRLGQTLSEG
ncbi:MAG: heat-inducible transcription repressor HrcA [Acidimicrobiia bacterium]|nr:heat-inducible transcription repressor HrcA [Acidimicrobiia bacterium]